ncbi:hypothetical protein ACODM8_01735 [Vibrio ostreicida]|uniref:hypothetical protein n=1 Tax=Vibrio ostreicida TaxID=526588 RepID=UPI003B5C1168
MAAVKLTKGRFAQIIIMLSLLITVFMWRTMSYKHPIHVVCEMKPTCTFIVNDSPITVTLKGTKLMVQKPSGNWHLNSPNLPFSSMDNANNWQVDITPINDVKFTLQDKEKVFNISVKF